MLSNITRYLNRPVFVSIPTLFNDGVCRPQKLLDVELNGLWLQSEKLTGRLLSREAQHLAQATYRSQHGHHVHQSAAYSPGGPSGTGNPNHNNAVTVALKGHPSDITTQHGRATAVQRLRNHGVSGLFSGADEVGPVSIDVSGEGSLPPSPNQSFEDVEAFYSMLAADAPGFQSGEDVFRCAAPSGSRASTI